ncbi:MAG: hypothetical protein EPN97_06035 [Alphaproteobacteria bacterium]|nr:MAG: hypothetical protein EPN97_06035 [Alphaproteobacteria bacterium]
MAELIQFARELGRKIREETTLLEVKCGTGIFAAGYLWVELVAPEVFGNLISNGRPLLRWQLWLLHATDWWDQHFALVAVAAILIYLAPKVLSK